MTTAAGPTLEQLGLTEQLRSMHRALLDDARRAADELLAEAKADAEGIVSAAMTERDDEIERARARGAAAGDRRAAIDAARARQVARSGVLAAQRAVYDECHQAVAEAVAQLRGEPDYPDLLDGWSALLRDRLGPNASVIKDPEPDGGVLASFGDRRVDATLTRLAALELAGMPEQLVTLWG